MICKLADAEDFQSGKPVKLIVLKPNQRQEIKAFRALRESNSRHLRVTFDDAAQEVRLVLPEDVVEALR